MGNDRPDSRFRDRAWALLGAVAGLLTLPALDQALDEYGPAGRVVFRPYFFGGSTLRYLFAGVLGAGLGWVAYRWARGRARFPRVLIAGSLVWLLWAAIPQLRAFPAHGSLAERDAWARRNVPEYAALARIVGAMPEITRDVGRVTGIAPAAGGSHVVTVDMDGNHLAFALDVVGEKGSGVFRSDCTLTQGRVWEWRPGRWSFGGQETSVDTKPPHSP